MSAPKDTSRRCRSQHNKLSGKPVPAHKRLAAVYRTSRLALNFDHQRVFRNETARSAQTIVNAFGSSESKLRSTDVALANYTGTNIIQQYRKMSILALP
uniref:Uncharacterized protein n=1 Tax=mine drainage metagenome TaxID=410659 RepID=E6PEQ2_9ZZZZ